MSHIICNHAVYKKGGVDASIKCNNDTEPFAKNRFGLEDFIGFTYTNEIVLTRKPVTKLEKAIHVVQAMLCGDRWEVIDEQSYINLVKENL